MPLPLLLIGVAAIVSAYGVKKGVDAKSDYDEAGRHNRLAEETYDDANKELKRAKNGTKNAIRSLGELKFSTYEDCLCPFVEVFSKIKNIDFDDNIILKDTSLQEVTHEGLLVMTESTLKMNEVVGGGVAALGSGGIAGLAAYGGVGLLGTATTGTSIASLSGAAATNATLAWLGGGSLATGGLGMAGGTMVLGGVVVAPVLAIGGLVMASKAEAAKENAYANLAEAELLAEQMKTAKLATLSIKSRSNEIKKVLSELTNRFSPILQDLKTLIDSNGTNYQSYSEEDKKGIFIVASLAKTIKSISDAPLINKNGVVTKKSRSAVSVGNKTIKSLDHVK